MRFGKVQNGTRYWTQVVREFPQSPQGRLRQQRPRSAGSSASSTRMFRRVVCVTNAPVPQGRLRNQRNVALIPWGGPPSCDPAPLTTSFGTVGQWERRHRAMVKERRGGDPKTDRATQRGGDPKTDLRKEGLSKQLGCEGRGPENPGKHENLQKEVHTAGGPGRKTITGRWTCVSAVSCFFRRCGVTPGSRNFRPRRCSDVSTFGRGGNFFCLTLPRPSRSKSSRSP